MVRVPSNFHSPIGYHEPKKEKENCFKGYLNPNYAKFEI
jgi:hypothetical protein